MALNHSIWLRCDVKTKHEPSEYWFLLCWEKQYSCRTMTQIYTQIVMESLMINFMISACILFDNSVISFSSFVCIIWLRQLFFYFLLSVVLWNWICLSHTGEMQYFHCISIHKMNIMQWNLLYHLMACILINLNATLWNKNHKTNSL